MFYIEIIKLNISSIPFLIVNTFTIITSKKTTILLIFFTYFIIYIRYELSILKSTFSKDETN